MSGYKKAYPLRELNHDSVDVGVALELHDEREHCLKSQSHAGECSILAPVHCWKLPVIETVC